MRSRLAAAALLALIPTSLGLVDPVTRLSGRVISTRNALAVQNATVALVVAQLSVPTNEVGEYLFEGIDLDVPDTLRITHPEYQESRIPLGSVPFDQLKLLIRLTPVPDTTGAHAR